jgi:transposase
MEAMRALRRRLSNILYRTMLDDAIAATVAQREDGPGRANGTRLCLQRDRLSSQRRLFGQPLPGPTTTQPEAPLPAAFDREEP